MASARYRQAGMWLVTCCCCVAVVVPVLRGGAPDPGAVGVLGIIAGFLFTNTRPSEAIPPRTEREEEGTP